MLNEKQVEELKAGYGMWIPANIYETLTALFAVLREAQKVGDDKHVGTIEAMAQWKSLKAALAPFREGEGK